MSTVDNLYPEQSLTNAQFRSLLAGYRKKGLRPNIVQLGVFSDGTRYHVVDQYRDSQFYLVTDLNRGSVSVVGTVPVSLTTPYPVQIQGGTGGTLAAVKSGILIGNEQCLVVVTKYGSGTTPISGSLTAIIQPITITGTVSVLPAAGSIVGTTPGFLNQSDTFSATGNGTAIDTGFAPARYTFIVVNSGATTWDVRLEGSIDNVNWYSGAATQIIQHTNTDGSGVYKFAKDVYFRYLRARCAGYTGGGSITSQWFAS